MSNELKFLKEGVKGKIFLGYELVSVTNAAVFRLSPPANAQSAELTIEDGGAADATLCVRYKYDSVAPTPSTGAFLGKGDTMEIMGQGNIAAIKLISVDAVTNKVHVNYFS